MVMKVVLSQFAREQLREIFNYYLSIAGETVAKRMIGNILSRLETLGKNPLMGQVEELLKEYAEDYRYLVEGNYKIIYRIAKESVIVESIFDCRQNPVKMTNFR